MFDLCTLAVEEKHGRELEYLRRKFNILQSVCEDFVEAGGTAHDLAFKLGTSMRGIDEILKVLNEEKAVYFLHHGTPTPNSPELEKFQDWLHDRSEVLADRYINKEVPAPPKKKSTWKENLTAFLVGFSVTALIGGAAIAAALLGYLTALL